MVFNISDIQLELRKFVAPEFIFGSDARLSAGNYCRQLGGKKILLVTDQGVLKTPWVNQVKETIENKGLPCEIYSSISPNPRDYEVMQGAEFYLDKQCNLIVAIGGGSVIDCAKGIGIVSSNKKTIDYFEGVDKITNPMPPLICIPTTAGTAADLSQFAIINKFDERYKMAIISKAAVPDIALIDPSTLSTMSPFLTACTGLDALTHSIEAFVSNASSAFTDLWALESIKIIVENLPLVINDAQNKQAQGKMMLASSYAGLAFSNASLGCVHAMAHSLGGYLDLPHGECNAILLPHVVNYNYESAPYKYQQILEIFNLNTKSSGSNDKRKELVDKLIDFKNSVGINTTLSNKGVSVDSIGTLASKAINDPCNATNPKTPKRSDLLTIFNEAL